MDKTKLEKIMTTEHTGTISEGLARRQERQIKKIMHERKCVFAEAYNALMTEDEYTLRAPAPSRPGQADYDELLEILDEQGRDGDGTSKSAAAAIRTLARTIPPSTAICAVSPPSPDTVREKDRADLAEKHLNQIYDYLGCCRSGSAVICTIKEREAALSSAPTPSTASTNDPDIVHEARFLLDRLEELNDANDVEYVPEFEGHIRPSMTRLRRLLPRKEGDTHD